MRKPSACQRFLSENIREMRDLACEHGKNNIGVRFNSLSIFFQVMECLESEEPEELQEFREKWKKELKLPTQGNKRIDLFSEQREKCHLVYEIKKNTTNTSGDIDCLEEDSATNLGINSTGNDGVHIKHSQTLFDFPNPEKKRKAATDQEECKEDCKGRADEKSLLEQLISDIDEITVIPFFDIQLPREVGVKIFSHLGMLDLCRCTQVSKTWKCLADDQLLWYRVACGSGYIKAADYQVTGERSWKDFVQDKVVMDHWLKKSWRERTCKLSVLEFERGGSLCSVSHHGHLICAGYSSGSVLLWDTASDEISYRMLQTTHEIQHCKHQVMCTAVAETLCAAGFENGDINIWHTSLDSAPLHHYRCEGAVKTVALSTDHQPTVLAASDQELRVAVADGCGQWKCQQQRMFEQKIGHVQFLPCNPKTSEQVVAIATLDVLSLLMPEQKTLLELDHVVGGKITCLDSSVDHLAVGVGAYGYGVLGNKVRLYCSRTGKMISLFSGHQREISCINLADSPPHCMVSGGHDWRVCIYDLRSATTVLSLRGHKSPVTAVQMDQWKAVSGSRDGSLHVWDQRMAGTLWMTHARHPVDVCHFNGSRLLTANVPVDKNPQQSMWYVDDLVLHRRHRGVVRIFDFRTENTTVGIPEICSSRYDDTSGYNYNINLSVPYDDI